MAEHYVRVRPAPTEDYLANPHKGCCTFQHFNGDELFPDATWSEEGPTEFPPLGGRRAPSGEGGSVVKGYLPTTVAYCRWFWRLMEPEKGKLDFSVIFALRFCQDDNLFIVPFKDVDVRTWLPGDFCLDRQVALPAGLRPGLVELSAGLIDPATQEAKVSFANKPRFKDRWLHSGKFEAVAGA